jgi:hypothetical protein
MVRNKNQSQDGSNGSQRKLSGDSKLNGKTSNREFLDEDIQENSRKPGKNASGRKGNLGKNNH